MSESSGLPVPGETALIAAGVLASQGKLQIEARHRDRRRRGDRRRQHRLPDRAQGRTLAARAARAFPPPAPAGARRGRAVLRAPRSQGRVLRALPARACACGPRGSPAPRTCPGARSCSGTRSAASRGRPSSASSPTSSATPPATSSRPSASTASPPFAVALVSALLAPPPRLHAARAPRTRAVEDAPRRLTRSGRDRDSRAAQRRRERSAPTCPPARSARSRRSARRSARGPPPDACTRASSRRSRPAVRQAGVGAARVVVAGAALEQPLALEAVDQARQAAARQLRLLGQVAHPHAPAARLLAGGAAPRRRSSAAGAPRSSSASSRLARQACARSRPRQARSSPTVRASCSEVAILTAVAVDMAVQIVTPSQPNIAASRPIRREIAVSAASPARPTASSAAAAAGARTAPSAGCCLKRSRLARHVEVRREDRRQQRRSGRAPTAGASRGDQHAERRPRSPPRRSPARRSFGLVAAGAAARSLVGARDRRSG